jgi:hypothetical protein
MIMCKRHHRTETRQEELRGAYEGETVRLDSRSGELSMARATGVHGHHGHFPWWVLWFIWPLAALFKGILVALAGAATAVATGLSTGAIPALHFLPLLLIVIAIMLLRRR